MAIYNIVYAATTDFGLAASGGAGSEVGETLYAANSATHSFGIGPSTGAEAWRQYFSEFDVSGVGTTVSQELVVTLTAIGGGLAGSVWNFSVSPKNWGGASLGEWVQGTTGGAPHSLEELGFYSGKPGATGPISISLSSFPNYSGSAKLIAYHRNQRGNGNSASLDRLLTFHSADATGTTNDPYLSLLGAGAWEYVGTGASSEVIVASQTLAEPAGCEAGDLLVAAISYRSTNLNAVGLPAGWSLVTESRTALNTTANSTAGTAGGVMAYIIRGASAPALTFTHPAAPSVALGRVVAYRNAAATGTLDASTSTLLAAGATAVSVAGLTTTQDDDLIVVAHCGGRNATASAFNATDPAGSSGTGANITANPALTWQERADVGTATGADTGLAIADAVKATTGATGNFTYTASASSRHAVLAGAFKILPAAPSGPTGTLAATETGLDTFASTGAVVVAGSLAATETGLDTFASTGAVAIAGTLAATETGEDVFAASGGGGAATGSMAATEVGDDVFASTGAVTVAGSLAATETGDDVFASTGSVPVQGTLAAVENNDVFISSGDIANPGGGTHNLNLLAVTVTGGTNPENALGAPNDVYTADTGNTNWSATFSVSVPSVPGTVPDGQQTLDIYVRKSEGTSSPSITGVDILQNGTLFASVLPSAYTVNSAEAEVLNITFSSVGLANFDNLEIVFTTVGVGGAPAARSSVQLDAIVWSAPYSLPAVAGDLAATEGEDTFAATGTVTAAAIVGSMAATETGDDVFASAGSVAVAGSLAATETGDDVFAASGGAIATGSMAATETGDDTFASTGSVVVAGSLAATEVGDDTFASTGVVVVQGTFAATEVGDDVFDSSSTPPVYLRPSATTVVGGWRTHSNGTDLHTAVNEATRDDGTFIRSNGSAGDTARIQIQAAVSQVDPAALVVLRYTVGKGGGSDVAGLTVRLIHGTTTVATWSHSNLAALELVEQTLTVGQKAAVNWETPDLYLELEAA